MNLDALPIVDLVLELGVVRMPTPVRHLGMPYYPRLGLAVDAESGQSLAVQIGEAGDAQEVLGRNTLRVALQNLQARPRQIAVRDVALAADLRVAVSDHIEIVVREALPALDEVFKEFHGIPMFGLTGYEDRGGLLDQPGMTLEQWSVYADAAREFYLAQPWRHLVDEDLIEVVSPAGPKGARFTQVLGAGGATFGLGFTASREALDKLITQRTPPRGGVWTVHFGELDALPFPDGQAWEQHRLPLAAPNAYSYFLRLSRNPKPNYPKPNELAWVEGLLRALAATTEPEIDAGQWSKTVQTHAGPATYELAIPDLLAAKASDQSLPASPDAIYALARQSQGRRELQLIRAALAIDADHVDSLLLLASRTSDPAEVAQLMRRAVEAARQKLGDAAITTYTGRLSEYPPARPYLAARFILAAHLEMLGQVDQAIDHFQDLCRLDPADPQGARHLLIRTLIWSGRLHDLEKLLGTPQYRDEKSPSWLFSRALLGFVREGRSADAIAALRTAAAQNPHVVPLLTGRRNLPTVAGPQDPGSPAEAADYVLRFGAVWEDIEGALEWLDETKLPAKKKANKKQ